MESEHTTYKPTWEKTRITPHQRAVDIARNDAEEKRERDTNADNLGAGKRKAAAKLWVLEEGPCSTCALLNAHSFHPTLGCQGEDCSPSKLALDLQTQFKYEIHCPEHNQLTPKHQPILWDDGNLSYLPPRIELLS